MKKIFMAILTAIFLVPTTAWGESGTCGTNVTWNLAGGVLTISGSGAMNEYNTASNPWYSSLYSQIQSVVIEDGITIVGKNAFQGLNSITTITIPTSVTQFNSSAFSGCSALKNVRYAGSAIQWASIVFGNATANPIYYAKSIEISGSQLTELVIPAGTTRIEARAFYNCTALTKITIEKCASLYIDNQAFYGCTGVTSIICKCTTPPTLQATGVFAKNVPLYVPESAIAAYESDTYWGVKFSGNINALADDPDPITSDIIIDGNKELVQAITGKSISYTLTVKGSNLEEDVVLSSEFVGLSITPTSLQKEDVMSTGGATVTVTLTVGEGLTGATIVANSGDANADIALQWYGITTTEYATVAALRLGITSLPSESYVSLTGEAVVTYKKGSEFYIQDETGAIKIDNEYGYNVSLAVGDKVSNIVVEYRGLSFGAQVLYIASDIAAISHDNPVVAKEVALESINEDLRSYLYMLVSIKNVEFSTSTSYFNISLNASFTQDGESGKFKPSSDLVGQEIPRYANITGFSTSVSTTIIQARSADDIEEASAPNIEFSDISTTEDWNAINGLTKNVTITRNFVGGVYNTMCFPFALSDGELNALFGAGREVRSLTGSEMENGTLILKFSANVSGTYAGRPYIVKPDADITESWTKYDATINTELTNATTSLVTFVGTIVPTELVASRNTLFLGSGNELFYVNEAAEIRGLRAYFQITESGAVGAPARIRLQNNTTTGVEDILDTDKAHKLMQEGRVIIRMDGHDYDLNGNMIR